MDGREGGENAPPNAQGATGAISRQDTTASAKQGDTEASPCCRKRKNCQDDQQECRDPIEAKLTDSEFCCLVCNIYAPRCFWDDHATSEWHQRSLAEFRRVEKDLRIELNPLIQRDLLLEQMHSLRSRPDVLLCVEEAVGVYGRRDAVEAVQRWIMKDAGVEKSAAFELHRAVLSSFAYGDPANDSTFHSTWDSFTELVAGVALAHVTKMLKAPSHRASPYYHEFSPNASCGLYLEHATHIAALAQLAPYAADLRATTFMLVLDDISLHVAPMLWLASCRLLLSKLTQLPFPPQRLDLSPGIYYGASGLASGLALSLLALPELHTLLEGVVICISTPEQETELREALRPGRWTEVTRRTVRAVRTMVLLGACRSQTSPLRVLPPSVVPLIVRHIKPCSLTVVHEDYEEYDYEQWQHMKNYASAGSSDEDSE